MRRAILAALALCLLVPAIADAKFSAARICGPSDCRTITFHDGKTLLRMEEPIVLRRNKAASVSPRGPWYRMTLCPERCRGPEAISARVFPRIAYVQIVGHRTGYRFSGEVLSAYRTATSGIAPYEPTAAPGQAPEDGGLPWWAWAAIAVGSVAIAAVSILLVRRRARAQVPERSSSRAAAS